MKLQHGRVLPHRQALAAFAVTGISIAATVGIGIGCNAADAGPKWTAFTEVPTKIESANWLPATRPGVDPVLRQFETEHFTIRTSLDDRYRRLELLTTLERSYDAYCDFLQVRPADDAPKMLGYVFATGNEWSRFTIATTGPLANVYLQTRRGGYTYDKLFVSRDAGSQDTLTVAAHEGLHLFIATHFVARPPPFIEEGLAACFESVRRTDSGIVIQVGENPARQRRLAIGLDERPLPPLREVLSMHAGQVVGLTILEVETFYAHAWAFVRFLREGEDGRYRPMFERMIADAHAGRLSSDDLSDNPAMVERYLGVRLDTIQPAFDRFAASLAKKAGVSRME